MEATAKDILLAEMLTNPDLVASVTEIVRIDDDHADFDYLPPSRLEQAGRTVATVVGMTGRVFGVLALTRMTLR